jgi:hypothetical protein
MPVVGHNGKPQSIKFTADPYIASQAWVWLGESEDNSDDAMDLVKSLHKIDFDDPTYQPGEKSWTALKRLFQRPWWGRLWVVQECLLAEKASVNCGKKVVGMESFVHLKQIEHKYRRSLAPRLKPMQVGLQSPFGVILWDWDRHKRMIAAGGIPLFQILSVTGACKCAKAVDKIFGLLSICTAEDRQTIPVDYRLKARDLVIMVAKYHLRRRERHNPLQMLQTHQAKKHPSLPSWVPDYTTDDFEDHLIFPASKDSAAFKAGANNAAWNAVASRVGNGRVRVLDLGIISTSDVIEALLLGARFFWAATLLFWGFARHPFATISKVRQRLQISTLVSLVAGRWLNSINLRIEDERSHETLVLPGLIVDDVSAAFRAPFVDFYLGSDLAGDVENKRRRREEMKEACRQWEADVSKLPPDADPYRETCGRREAFWRTLIADRDYYWRGPPPAEWDFSGRFEAWMCGRDDSACREAYTRPFSDAAIVRCLYRSFIVTERGYLGLGRNSTQRGDTVCVLRGGNVPFILRKKDDGYYELVGEAYVHGIMDGSFVRKSRKEELKEFRIR